MLVATCGWADTIFYRMDVQSTQSTCCLCQIHDEGDLSQGMLVRFNGFDFQVDSL